MSVCLHREVLAGAENPRRIAFAFGPLGRCHLMLPPVTVLFACVHNAGRSQMAAAFFNAAADPSRALALSAGTRPAPAIHDVVVAVMREAGLDLSGETPRALTPALAEGVTLLVTMGCGEECPVVPGAEREDWPLDDPAGRPIGEVRRIRDEIRRRVTAMVESRGWRR